MGNTGDREDENWVLVILKHAVENTNEAFVTIEEDHKVLFFNLNLVKNSIEAMGNGGTMSIQTRMTSDQVEITVADEGCWIPKEDEGKIFTPFFTTNSHGTGLGLSISKRIIDEHAGRSSCRLA